MRHILRAGQAHALVVEAIQAALEGRLDPFPLMSHTVPMGSLDTGLQLTRERPDGFVKALLLPES